jgi:hypothetical protein
MLSAINLWLISLGAFLGAISFLSGNVIRRIAIVTRILLPLCCMFVAITTSVMAVNAAKYVIGNPHSQLGALGKFGALVMLLCTGYALTWSIVYVLCNAVGRSQFVKLNSRSAYLALYSSVAATASILVLCLRVALIQETPTNVMEGAVVILLGAICGYAFIVLFREMNCIK